MAPMAMLPPTTGSGVFATRSPPSWHPEISVSVTRLRTPKGSKRAVRLVSPSILGTSTGPDVIVVGLVDVNYYGSLGNISAYAIGTDACNGAIFLRSGFKEAPSTRSSHRTCTASRMVASNKSGSLS